MTYLLNPCSKEQIWCHVILDDVTSKNILSRDAKKTSNNAPKVIPAKYYIKNAIKNISTNLRFLLKHFDDTFLACLSLL